jgi:hypothetical protein
MGMTRLFGAATRVFNPRADMVRQDEDSNPELNGGNRASVEPLTGRRNPTWCGSSRNCIGGGSEVSQNKASSENGHRNFDRNRLDGPLLINFIEQWLSYIAIQMFSISKKPTKHSVKTANANHSRRN